MVLTNVEQVPTQHDADATPVHLEEPYMDADAVVDAGEAVTGLSHTDGYAVERDGGLVHGVWYGMVEVCEGAPVAVSGWVLTDRHEVRPCVLL